VRRPADAALHREPVMVDTMDVTIDAEGTRCKTS
jgi:hypothetical protein